MTLLSGERQVAPTLSGIRGDHVARYRFAATRLRVSQTVLDAGCGIGYGAHLLAEAGHDVHAWDSDAEAVAYGREHYEHPRIRWSVGNICELTCLRAFAVVAFEILEHLWRPGLALIRFPDVMIASVPNAKVAPKTPGSYPYHVRHYTPEELECLLLGAGYEVRELWSQYDLTDAPLARDAGGRTLVAVCER